jgi:hypothetical protein
MVNTPYVVVSLDVREAYFGSLDRSFEGFSFVDDSHLKKSHAKPNGFSTSYGRCLHTIIHFRDIFFITCIYV